MKNCLRLFIGMTTLFVIGCSNDSKRESVANPDIESVVENGDTRYFNSSSQDGENLAQPPMSDDPGADLKEVGEVAKNFGGQIAETAKDTSGQVMTAVEGVAQTAVDVFNNVLDGTVALFSGSEGEGDDASISEAPADPVRPVRVETSQPTNNPNADSAVARYEAEKDPLKGSLNFVREVREDVTDAADVSRQAVGQTWSEWANSRNSLDDPDVSNPEDNSVHQVSILDPQTEVAHHSNDNPPPVALADEDRQAVEPVQIDFDREFSFCDQSNNFVSLSEETQSVIWKAIWSNDGSQVVSLNGGRNTYTLSNAVPVSSSEMNGFDVLISNQDLTTARRSLMIADRRYFHVLYVQNSGDTDKIKMQVRKLSKAEFMKVYDAAKSKSVLADYPIAAIEACYLVVAEKMDTMASVVFENGDSDSSYLSQFQDLFQNRKASLTASYGAWKNASHTIQLMETNVELRLVDTSEDERIPLNITFKQPAESTDVVRLRVTGLEVPAWLGISSTLLDDEIFNEHLKQNTLNPFEVAFGLSIGEGSDQIDMDVRISAAN